MPAEMIYAPLNIQLMLYPNVRIVYSHENIFAFIIANIKQDLCFFEEEFKKTADEKLESRRNVASMRSAKFSFENLFSYLYTS